MRNLAARIDVAYFPCKTAVLGGVLLWYGVCACTARAQTPPEDSPGAVEQPIASPGDSVSPAESANETVSAAFKQELQKQIVNSEAISTIPQQSQVEGSLQRIIINDKGQVTGLVLRLNDRILRPPGVEPGPRPKPLTNPPSPKPKSKLLLVPLPRDLQMETVAGPGTASATGSDFNWSLGSEMKIIGRWAYSGTGSDSMPLYVFIGTVLVGNGVSLGRGDVPNLAGVGKHNDALTILQPNKSMMGINHMKSVNTLVGK